LSPILQRAPRRRFRPVSWAAVLVISLAAWAWPKLAVDTPSGSTALYRGFQSFQFLWLGPRYYRLHRDASHFGELDWYDTSVEFESDGDNKFSAWYPDGSLAAKGICRAAQQGKQPIPIFNPLNVVDAEFYKPDGTLAARVTRGTGTQVHYRPDGGKSWEIEMRDFKWFHSRSWYDSGQLRDDADLEDGAFHGWVVGYYDNGHKQYERRYVSGKRIGPDKSYDVRGNLQSVDYYDPPGDLTRREYYDKGKLLRTVRL
jgi:hypothetical protein